LCAVTASANHLAVRYLLELSTDIRGALLLDRDGEVLAWAGNLPTGDLPSVARRLADAARGLSQNGRPGHPGLIFYDMHAVLRDLERAAAAEAVREGGGAR
jgi:hypothetical protein